MATEVSICSNAVVRLGGEPFSSFDEADVSGDNIERVRAAANLWPTVRQAVLRGHIWNCATKRALLSPDVTPPAFGWSYRFLLPSDWLRTVALGRDPRDRFEYVSEGRYLLTNEPELPLVYVFDNTNPATYDSSLVNALETAMAGVLAYPVTKSTSLAAELDRIVGRALATARATDGQDDPPLTLGDQPLLLSRFGGRYTGGR